MQRLRVGGNGLSSSCKGLLATSVKSVRIHLLECSQKNLEPNPRHPDLTALPPVTREAPRECCAIVARPLWAAQGSSAGQQAGSSPSAVSASGFNLKDSPLAMGSSAEVPKHLIKQLAALVFGLCLHSAFPRSSSVGRSSLPRQGPVREAALPWLCLLAFPRHCCLRASVSAARFPPHHTRVCREPPPHAPQLGGSFHPVIYLVCLKSNVNINLMGLLRGGE